MFGSGVVKQHVYNVLRVRPTIQAAIGDPARIKARRRFPQGMALPAAIHYMDRGVYSGPVNSGAPPSEETITYIVRFACEGESDQPIRAAAKDAVDALTVEHDQADISQDDEQFHISVEAAGEWPLTDDEAGGVEYSQLGFFLTCHVFRV